MTLLWLVDELQLWVFIVLAAIGVAEWRRQRSEAAAWTATTVLVLAGLAAYGRVIGPGDGGAVATVARRAIVVVLAAFPYTLYRLTSTFAPVRRWQRRLAFIATAVMAGAALILPSVTPPVDRWPWWLTAYATGMVVQWSGLSIGTVGALVAGGRGQPAVVQRRMELLGAAAVVLTLALLILVGSGGSRSSTAQLWQQGAGLASGVLLLVGFSPTPALRMVWRRREMEAFRSGETELMAADTAERVASVILPHAIALLGARAAVLVDERGEVRSHQGVGAVEAAALAARLPGPEGDGRTAKLFVQPDLVAVPVRSGWLAVATTPATPLFGGEEIGLLSTLGHLAGLALDRVEAFDRERASRQALAEREYQLAEAQRTAQIGSYTWDPTTGEVMWSDEMHRLLGFEPGQAVDHGPAFASRIHPDDRARVLEAWAASHAAATASTIEYRIVRGDGEVRWIHGRVQPVLEGPGAGHRLVGTLQDITERRQAEARLREAFEREQRMVAELQELARVKTDFVSTVSHELRTPLTSIAGYLELLGDGDAGPLTANQLEVLEVIGRNARRLTSLIEDLLTLSNIDAGGFRLNPAPLDVARLIDGVHQAVLPSAFAQGLTLHVDVADGAGVLVADAEQVDRVLLNLLSNAIKFTPAGGRVSLRVARHRGEMVFTVADTGIGIPIDEQPHLFSRFFRSSNATDAAIQGTGLGLAIVKTIVEAHGGRVALESVPTVGTTVTFTLPAPDPATGAAAAAVADRAS